jgi:hypothetical protein
MTNAAAEAAINIVILLNMNSSSVNWGARLARFCCGPALYPPVRAMVQHGSSLTSIAGAPDGRRRRPKQSAAFCRQSRTDETGFKNLAGLTPDCTENDPDNQAK